MQDILLVRTLYRKIIGVELIKDPVIQVVADSVLTAQTDSITKIVHVIYDTGQHALVELAQEGPASQFPHAVLFSICSLPATFRVSRNQCSEKIEAIQEQARALKPETVRAVVSDYASFLERFSSVYGRLSKGMQQVQTKLAPSELVCLTLSLIAEVMSFENLKE
jgi:hypothetical protein